MPKLPLPSLLSLLLILAAATSATAQQAYYPPRGSWETRDPAQVGLDPERVRRAVEIARTSESQSPRDLLANHARSFGREPHGEATGPFKERGGAAGLIIRNGFIVAEWGDTERVDVTFSVTKSFLSTTVGLAFDRGLIRDLNEPVHRSMAPVVALVGPPGAGPSEVTQRTVATGAAYPAFEVIDLFAGEHNRRITWDHLLRQTSDWQGTLWGKPDWADRARGNLDSLRNRPRHEPGTVYTYNDVRVNVLALASLNVWRQPLPAVLRQHVMDPIGASESWRWYGYDNSWLVLDGQLVQSVSGGAHWGGGMWINARDMARFGLLTLRRGRWGERQILSERWIQLATTPTPAQPTYGFMNFFLNTGRRPLPAAPEPAFYHLGAGSNTIYVDPINDIVIVARWINNIAALNSMIEQLAVRTSPDEEVELNTAPPPTATPAHEPAPVRDQRSVNLPFSIPLARIEEKGGWGRAGTCTARKAALIGCTGRRAGSRLQPVTHGAFSWARAVEG